MEDDEPQRSIKFGVLTSTLLLKPLSALADTGYWILDHSGIYYMCISKYPVSSIQDQASFTLKKVFDAV
jgi:hypothetical protein